MKKRKKEMAKFKKTEFDYTQVAILSNGRYLLVGGMYGEDEYAQKLIARVCEEFMLTRVMTLNIPEKAFRYLCRKIQPAVDNLYLENNTIVIYHPNLYVLCGENDVPLRLVK